MDCGCARLARTHGIGWAMWDYDRAFGVVTRENGQPVPDEMTAHALGVKCPAVVDVELSKRCHRVRRPKS